MKTSVLVGVLALLAVCVFAADADTVANSNVWFAKFLRARFPAAVPIHGYDYPIQMLPCAPADLTSFNISTTHNGGVLRISGSVRLAALPKSLEVAESARGASYMLHLQAYLFSPRGSLVWTQKGFPAGGAWKSATGDTAEFSLNGSYAGATTGYELLVLAAGDPIFAGFPETRVLLGAKSVTLP